MNKLGAIILLVAVFGYGYSQFVGLQDTCPGTKFCSCQNFNNSTNFYCNRGGDSTTVTVTASRTRLLIDCNDGVGSFTDILPKLNESFFNSSELQFTLRACTLPKKFREISEHFPPIVKAKFTSGNNDIVSKDFFEKNSIIEDLSVQVEIDAPPIWHNLKNLENLTLLLRAESGNHVPSTIFQENLKLKICKLSIKGENISLPSQLFSRNEALEYVGLSLYHSWNQFVGFEDELFSNKKNLKKVHLYNRFPATTNEEVNIPDRLFRNSTNLETITLFNFGLTRINL